MAKVIFLGACWLLLLTMPAFAQETTATIGAQPGATQAADNETHSYEIVSIKPNKAGSGSGGMRTLPDGFAWTNIPLASLVKGSYGVMLDNQVSGMPDWAKLENYDIVAKADAQTAERWKKESNKDRYAEEQRMMQSILKDRCQFTGHLEMKEMPVYDLVIGKRGLKMKEALPNEAPIERTNYGQLTVHSMRIDTITSAFAGKDGRMIVDKTGLGDKRFDFELNWSPDDRPPADDAAPSLFTALEEQLGLKLVPAKGPVKVLVIDHMERPSPN